MNIFNLESFDHQIIDIIDIYEKYEIYNEFCIMKYRYINID